MKNLYDITEGILDVDDMMDKGNDAALFASHVDWLKTHGIRYRLDSLLRDRDSMPNVYDTSTCTWNLDMNTIKLTKDDKYLPEHLNIINVKGLQLAGYTGTTIPDLGIMYADEVIIRNCPKLKSLRGCPQDVSKFAVSGCPNIKSLDGCPSVATNLFKFINNGISVTWNMIKRVCKVQKDCCVYDRSI